MTRNVAASVHQRLLNRARAERRPFNELLQYFALERFLYRLGRSQYSTRFVLKGALMFGVWHGSFSRPTRDVDLLGRLKHTVEHITTVMQAICKESVPEDDGLRFDAASVACERIVKPVGYEGVRARFMAYLGNARIPMQIDIGFGDRLVPGPSMVRLPALLDFPPPEVQGYSQESAIAEKFQAMVYLGEANSRMKDFYDIWLLATQFEFDGAILAEAIQATFRQRQTELPPSPIVFSESFASNRDKQTQWVAFTRRLQASEAPASLSEAIRVIAAFLQPVAQALSEGHPFDCRWLPDRGCWEGDRAPNQDRT